MESKFSIIIGDKHLSSWSLRAWIMLKQVNVKFNEHTINLHTSTTHAKILKYSTTGQYLFNQFTIADAMFAPIVLRFKTYNYYPKNPVIQDYCNTILNNPLIKEWI